MHESSAKGANQRDQTIWEGEVAGEKAVGEAVGCEARKRALGWRKNSGEASCIVQGAGRQGHRQRGGEAGAEAVAAGRCVC